MLLYNVQKSILIVTVTHDFCFMLPILFDVQLLCVYDYIVILCVCGYR